MNANGSRWTAQGVHPGDERLAAFVDGRLPSRERERIVAHLASCEECFEVFSGTVGVQTEEAEESESVVSPPYWPAKRALWRRPVVWRRWMPAAALAAAAAVTVVIMAPWERSSPASELPVKVLASTVTGADTAATVKQGIDAHGWRQTLGPESLGTAEATAFSLGVRVVELEVALTAGDRASSEILTYRVDSLLRNVELGEVVGHTYFSGPGGLRDLLGEQVPTTALLDLHREADMILSSRSDEGQSFVDPFWYAFGKWAEAGYLAAVTGREGHFRSPEHQRFRRELERANLPDSIEQALDQLDELLQAGESGTRLAEGFAVLIRRSGGGAH